MTLVCASLVERGIAGVSRSSRLAFRQGADLVELRLDMMGDIGLKDISRLREAVEGKAIATLRSALEGGRSRLSSRRRREALERVLCAGFEYVDLELGADRKLLAEFRGRRGCPTLIASSHFAMPVSISAVSARLEAACAAGDIGKVAMPCEHAGQALALADLALEFLRKGRTHCLIGMGDQGQLTRVCARRMGSALVYASLRGKAAAPGQLDIVAQRDTMQGNSIALGLLGHPISHSVSRQMQEAALRRAGLPGAYLPLDVPRTHLTRSNLELLKAIGFRGLNVTIPHKEAVLRLCDRAGESAQVTGAVNTVYFDGGAIVGENTDVNGFATMIDGKTGDPKGRSALVFGAGGAARAAAYVLSGKGFRVTITARRAARARALAAELGTESAPLAEAVHGDRGVDVIVNCTPAGTRGDSDRTAVPSRMFRKGTVFFDMVYNPVETASMKAARRKGANAFGGLEMLVRQGAASFRIWTGIEPDIATMRSAARRAVG